MAQHGNNRAGNLKPPGVRVTAATCVRCDKPVVPRYRPFCSQRCSDLDLAGWLTGQYRIPTEEAPNPEAAEPSAAEDDGDAVQRS